MSDNYSFLNSPTILGNSKTSISRPIFCESFDDGSGFAFNPENPQGVKYLPKESHKAYQNTLLNLGNPPLIGAEEFHHAKSLADNGLALSRLDPFPVMPKVKPKTLTVWFHISNACNLGCSYCYIPKLMKTVDLDNMSNYFISKGTASNATHQLFEYCKSNGFENLIIKYAGGRAYTKR